MQPTTPNNFKHQKRTIRLVGAAAASSITQHLPLKRATLICSDLRYLLRATTAHQRTTSVDTTGSSDDRKRLMDYYY